MGCESKTLINDVGSAVLAEVVKQLSNASSVTPFTHVIQATDTAGTAGPGADTPNLPDGDNTSGILFIAHEDCFVTSIKLCQTSNELTTVNDYICVLKVPLPWTDSLGVLRFQQCGFEVGGTNSITAHGDAVAIPLGGGQSTYTVEYLSDGTPLPTAPATGVIYDLFDVTAAGGPCPAGTFNNSWVALDHAGTPVVSLNPNGILMNAGDVLMYGMYNSGGGTVRQEFCVGYAPVKDKLILTPDYAQLMRNYSVKDRDEG
jgi:hypothetical protein